MRSAVTEQELCGRCGADVRPDSLFCYACGAQIASVAPSRENGNESVEPNAHRPGALAPDLKTAASINRSSEKRVKKKVEIVWEPGPDRPNPLFVTAAIACGLFAALVVVLALYFK